MSRLAGLRRAVLTLCLIAALLVPAVPASGVAPTAPSLDSTARLLGYLWADGKEADGVWDAAAPSAGSALIEALVERHGGTWVDRTQLQFRLPTPYEWSDWKDGLPADDQTVSAAVRNPHFLAALLESEGLPDGHVYDQFSCCTDFTRGRVIELVALLRERGYETATFIQDGDVNSGSVAISGTDITEVRQQLEFVCPASAAEVRVVGGENYGQFGPIQWLDGVSEWAAYHRTDCVPGRSVNTTPPPPGGCSVFTVQPGTARVSWTFDRGRIAIRSNAEFVDRVSVLERSIDIAATGTASIEVEVIRDGKTRTVGCGSTNPSVVDAPRCRGALVTIQGTDAGDVLYGTPGRDVISTGLGNDLVRSLEGDDVVCTGDGRDFIEAGPGRDIVSGGTGWDTMFGQAGPDVLIAGPGSDTVIGGGGNDRLIGGVGDDTLVGGNGNDRLRGRAGDDVLDGGRLHDVCDSGGGADTFARCEVRR